MHFVNGMYMVDEKPKNEENGT